MEISRCFKKNRRKVIIIALPPPTAPPGRSGTRAFYPLGILAATEMWHTQTAGKTWRSITVFRPKYVQNTPEHEKSLSASSRFAPTCAYREEKREIQSQCYIVLFFPITVTHSSRKQRIIVNNYTMFCFNHNETSSWISFESELV